MAVKIKDKKKKDPNDHIGEPVDAPVGHMPRVVKVPMHDKAAVNPKFHAAKEEEKKKKETPDVGLTGVVKGVGWNAKDERMYNHIKDSGESESVAAATVNKQRRKEGRTKVSKSTPNVNIVKGGPGSGPRKGGERPPAAWQVQQAAGRKAASSTAMTHASAPAEHRISTPLNAMSSTAHAASKTAAEHDTSASHFAAATAHDNAGTFHSQHPKGSPELAKDHFLAANNHTERAHVLKKREAPKDPSLFKGSNMAKNAVSDLFKAELGKDPGAPITNCVHCKHSLTREDLKKGLGPHFVVDDNDNPHDGDEHGHVEPSRPGAGVPEYDVIAPLLKSCKGPEAGEQEEYPISKGEMAQMGMDVSGVEGEDTDWFTISKAEMKRVEAGGHIAYLESRKALIAKGTSGSGTRGVRPAKGPAGADASHWSKPRGDEGHDKPYHGPSEDYPRPIKKSNREELTVWFDSGTDKATADWIEKMGPMGQGNDESIRTQGNGEHE